MPISPNPSSISSSSEIRRSKSASETAGHCRTSWCFINETSAKGVDDFAGGVSAAGTGEAVAGMRAGAAEKKAANGSLVARPIENGAHGEELIEREFAVKNVPAGEAVGGFEIFRRDDLHGFDEIRQVRHVGGEDVLAVGSERGIENRGNGDVEPGGA